ncbi:MAG: hypothetical protein AB7N76_11615 [Planctomycetota bacterium]
MLPDGVLYAASALPLGGAALRCFGRCARARGAATAGWFLLGLLTATVGVDAGISLRVKLLGLPPLAAAVVAALAGGTLLHLAWREWDACGPRAEAAPPAAEAGPQAAEAAPQAAEAAPQAAEAAPRDQASCFFDFRRGSHRKSP